MSEMKQYSNHNDNIIESSINNINLNSEHQHKPILYNETKQKRKSRIIKWDEVTIEEHNKERGTRQKIDEPPTPFRYSSESDQSEAESVDSNNSSRRRRHIKKKSIQFASNNEKPHEVMNEWSQLHAKLNYENFKQLENYNDMNDEMSIEDSPGSNANIPNDMDDSSDYEINQKKNEFKEKRLAHYNEFKILQALKNKLLSEDDDDDRSIADSKK